jgi:glutamine synthetase
LKLVIETERSDVELTPCFVLPAAFPIFPFHDFSEIHKSGNASHSWTHQTPHKNYSWLANSQSVGAEIEFCLVDPKTSKAVDSSVFANSTTLNNQEAFVSDLYDQLKQQHIDIELVHAESGECV